jgi:hypothetical protein
MHGFYLSESVGIAAMISEFLLQSVDNIIRVFPCWPKEKDAKFTHLRAQGGFLVSAEQKAGKIRAFGWQLKKADRQREKEIVRQQPSKRVE